jgi:hypothetical protein
MTGLTPTDTVELTRLFQRAEYVVAQAGLTATDQTPPVPVRSDATRTGDCVPYGWA